MSVSVFRFSDLWLKYTISGRNLFYFLINNNEHIKKIVVCRLLSTGCSESLPNCAVFFDPRWTEPSRLFAYDENLKLLSRWRTAELNRNRSQMGPSQTVGSERC